MYGVDMYGVDKKIYDCRTMRIIPAVYQVVSPH